MTDCEAIQRVVIILIFLAWLWIGLCMHLLPCLFLRTLASDSTKVPPSRLPVAPILSINANAAP